MARMRVHNRFTVAADADRSAVQAFAAEIKTHGAAHYGPNPNEGEPGQLPFYVDVDADSRQEAIDRALKIVDTHGDLQRWLHFEEGGGWVTEPLPDA